MAAGQQIRPDNTIAFGMGTPTALHEKRMNASMSSLLRAAWGILAPVSLASSVLHAQHLHLNVGASRPQKDVPLSFINGNVFSTNSAWFLPMPLQTNGLHKGLYRAGSLTITALPATPDNGGPDPWRAALGSRIVAEVVSLEGPHGGEIAFWDSDGVAESDSITFRVPVGATNGTWRFTLSEGDGSPGSDPYGHIHGRYFTTATPGLYTLGIRAVDVSTSSSDGGPWHMPSPVLRFHLQADATLQYLPSPPRIPPIPGWVGNATVQFAMEKERRYALLFSTGVEPTAWRALWGPVLGNGTVHSLTVQGPTGTTGYYRLLIQ